MGGNIWLDNKSFKDKYSFQERSKWNKEQSINFIKQHYLEYK